ncbi:hypothetical protein JCM33374_g4414 [Metschnikowia sp. JCM 33374]|nr:hypothetical protein JCM33374_g4414 [Metschnikowia sp. JCM 33374]
MIPANFNKRFGDIAPLLLEESPGNKSLKADYPQNSTMDVCWLDGQFNQFVGLLKSYISEVFFQYAVFEKDAPRLEAELSEMIWLFKNMSPQPKGLFDQVKHCRTFLEAMTQATSHMTQEYDILDSRHTLISDVFHVRLISLMLLDSRGLPSPGLPGLKGRVARLASRLDRLDDSVRLAGKKMPLDMLSVFQSQYRRTRSTLEKLNGRHLVLREGRQ